MMRRAELQSVTPFLWGGRDRPNPDSLLSTMKRLPTDKVTAAEIIVERLRVQLSIRAEPETKSSVVSTPFPDLAAVEPRAAFEEVADDCFEARLTVMKTQIDHDGGFPMELAEIQSDDETAGGQRPPQDESSRRCAVATGVSLTSGDYGQSLLHAHEPHLHSVMLYDFGRDGGNIPDVLRRRRPASTCQARNRGRRPPLPSTRSSLNLALLPLLGSILHLRSSEVEDDAARTRHEVRVRVRDPSWGKRVYLERPGMSLERYREEVLVPGDLALLTYDEVHSVNTKREHAASDVAWLVIEGPELQGRFRALLDA